MIKPVMQESNSSLTTVSLSEVFTSIEGEGVFVGTKTLFVRLAGCPLKCHWCDTTYAIPLDSGESISTEEAKQRISTSLEPNTFKVNFTGGETLVQYGAVIELAKHVQKLGLRTYLESAFYDFSRFAKVFPFIDICKIEFKLSDSNAVSSKNHENMISNELQCLQYTAKSGSSAKTTYVKVVVTESSSLSEFRELVRMIFTTVSPSQLAGFIIQPSHKISEPSLGQLVKFYDVVYPYFQDVRVVPQIHKALGAR